MIPFAARSATKVGESGNSESPQLWGPASSLLFPDILDPGGVGSLTSGLLTLLPLLGWDFLPLSSLTDFWLFSLAWGPFLELLLQPN